MQKFDSVLSFPSHDLFLVHCLAYTCMSSNVQRESFVGENFCEFHSFGAIRESFNCKNFHRVRQSHYQWACHCHFPQFTKVLIVKIQLSAIGESLHPRKIPTIRYNLKQWACRACRICKAHSKKLSGSKARKQVWCMPEYARKWVWQSTKCLPSV